MNCQVNSLLFWTMSPILLDHHTYCCLILRQFVVSIFHTQHSDKHIQRAKFRVLKSIANMQCLQKPNCSNHLTTLRLQPVNTPLHSTFLAVRAGRKYLTRKVYSFARMRTDTEASKVIISQWQSNHFAPVNPI